MKEIKCPLRFSSIENYFVTDVSVRVHKDIVILPLLSNLISWMHIQDRKDTLKMPSIHYACICEPAPTAMWFFFVCVLVHIFKHIQVRGYQVGEYFLW